jgi:hypothetical protein
MEKNNLVGGDYVETYAGGAGVGIQLLLSGKSCLNSLHHLISDQTLQRKSPLSLRWNFAHGNEK